MPKFKENTSPAMKRSGFKMKGYSYPGTSPIAKKSGMGATAAKGFDVDDLADLKEQNKAKKAVASFISECFNSNGSIKDKIYIKTPSKWTCNFCPFKEEQELCGAGLDFL